VWVLEVLNLIGFAEHPDSVLTGNKMISTRAEFKVSS
jgi:hypothetical protein